MKKELYQRAGVPEYWVIDPDEQVIEQHVLEGGAYTLAANEHRSIAFRGLPDVTIDLAEVW